MLTAGIRGAARSGGAVCPGLTSRTNLFLAGRHDGQDGAWSEPVR